MSDWGCRRVGDSVYLRCWGDTTAKRWSWVLATSRRWSQWRGDLERRSAGRGRQARRGRRDHGEWVDDVPEIGRAYRFTGPWAHDDTALGCHTIPGSRPAASIYPDRPERRSKIAGPPASSTTSPSPPATSTFAEWYRDVLGFRIMARTLLDEAPISVFSVLTTNEKSHDLGVVLDGSLRPAGSTTTRSGLTLAKNCSSLQTR